ncbi:MAG: hypothetical protein ACKVWR_17055 [Acidimicrobiales bacterium]
MAWCCGVPPAAMELSCGGARHRVRWRRGRLHLEDHPDAAGEAALAALGATPPACLDLLALWRQATADGGFVAEWAVQEQPDPRRRRDLAAALARLQREGVQDFLRELPPRRALAMGRVLAAFPPAMLDRAALAVAERARRGQAAELVPHLEAAVRVRARSAFARSLIGWRDYARPAPLVPFTCRVGAGAPSAAGLLRGRASWAEVTLQPTWLLDVWARGLAVVDGWFVTSAAPDGAATVVRWRPAGRDAVCAELAAAELSAKGQLVLRVPAGAGRRG